MVFMEVVDEHVFAETLQTRECFLQNSAIEPALSHSVWTGLQDGQLRWHVYPCGQDAQGISYSQPAGVWGPRAAGAYGATSVPLGGTVK